MANDKEIDSKLLSELETQQVAGGRFESPRPRLIYEHTHMRRSHDFLIHEPVNDMVGLDVVMVPRSDKPGLAYMPALSLAEREVQELFDQLWSAGFRPSYQRYTDSTLDALTQARDFAQRALVGVMAKQGIQVPEAA